MPAGKQSPEPSPGEVPGPGRGSHWESLRERCGVEVTLGCTDVPRLRNPLCNPGSSLNGAGRKGLGTSPTAALPATSNQLGVWGGSPRSVGAATRDDALAQAWGKMVEGGWPANTGARDTLAGGSSCGEEGETQGFRQACHPWVLGLVIRGC